ncbi:MAG: hypothetical protein ACI4PV_00310 [Butyricicoccus sp.]
MLQWIVYPIENRNLREEVSVFVQSNVAGHLELNDVQHTQTTQFYLWKDQQSRFYVIVCEKSFLLPRSRILHLMQLENPDFWEEERAFEKLQVFFEDGALSVDIIDHAPTFRSYILSIILKISAFAFLFCMSDFLQHSRQK